ncbi:hypothetical protein SIN8267_02467 [Sinobacterium norvegicum]|uniref:HTH lysR-type domain-containing protein n=1 Tax=Sinobacterium norvegicum TaxID=1641715 RepID=A0ABN8EKY2_9GAMM|nr:LysR family transcriptional regulator [Sinobacterium norvegicum]CAH0992348.1 hypothetical protein SIN8267_02467 [Sinobacterium norvegicum]
MHSMNWELIKIFLAVHRNGSATAAAKSLKINHATVIRRLAQLEQNLQLRLFDHLQTGYRITDVGRALLDDGLKMEAAAVSFERKAQSRGDQAGGVLKVSMPETAFVDLSAALKGFHQRYPQIELQLLSTAKISNMARLEADVVIRLTNEPPVLLVGKQVQTVGFGAYAHRDYIGQFDDAPTAEQCGWILWSGSEASPMPEVNQPVRLLQQVLPALRLTLTSNSMAEIITVVRAAMGVGLLSHQVAAEYPELVALPFDNIVARAGLDSAGLWLLTHQDLRDSERVMAFIRFFSEQLSSQ